MCWQTPCLVRTRFRGQMDSEVGGVPPVKQEGPVLINLFCHLVESLLFTLVFALPRSLSDRCGCASSELGQVSGVFFSNLVNDTSGSEEAPLIFWGPHDSSFSILTPEGVVSGPSRPRSGQSNQSSGVSRSPEIPTFFFAII